MHSPLTLHMQGGFQILFTKIRFTSLEITLAKLFLCLSGDDECVGEWRVVKVMVADRRSSSGGVTGVDLTAPVTLCEEFSAKYSVSYIVKSNVDDLKPM